MYARYFGSARSFVVNREVYNIVYLLFIWIHILFENTFWQSKNLLSLIVYLNDIWKPAVLIYVQPHILMSLTFDSGIF